MILRKKVLAACFFMIYCLSLAGCQNNSPVAQAQPMDASAAQANQPSSTPTPPLLQSPTRTASPTITLTPTPAGCQERHGKIEQHEVSFNENAEAFQFRVYLPPCYGQNAKLRYPVVYLIHGQTFADDQWERLGAAEAADSLIKAKKTPPFIIVMPREENTYEDIYASSFTEDLTVHLLNWVDSTYQTCAKRECRAIGGLSRGGAWALRLGFRHPDLYGAVGMHSTPPFIGDPLQFVYWQREIPSGKMPAVYMDIGKNDPYLAPNTEFEKLLTSLKVPHQYLLNDGNHEEKYWSAHVGEYLLWYGQNWNRLPKNTLMGQ